MNKYGITPIRAAQFLDHLAATHDGAIPPHVLADVAPHVLALGKMREDAIVSAWPVRSDEIAAALRKHGYDAWGWDQAEAALG